MLKRLLKLVGWFFVSLLLFAFMLREFVGLLGDVDFAVKEYHRLGGVGGVMEFILKPPPGAILGGLLLLASFLICLNWQRLLAWLRPKSGSKELHGEQSLSVDDTDPYVSLHEAALTAYEETRGTKVATIAEGLNSDNVLGYYAHALFDGSTTLYGKHPPSRILEPIPNVERSRCGFSSDQSALRRHGVNRNLYEDLQIRRSDLLRRITELKDQSETLAREARARKIDGLYARAVALRNHAASLRVLDADTESKMAELQDQLIEEMRELAPERSIVLATLNVYDPSKHPKMSLQDPKRTLEFSEFLLRVMNILADYK